MDIKRVRTERLCGQLTYFIDDGKKVVDIQRDVRDRFVLLFGDSLVDDLWRSPPWMGNFCQTHYTVGDQGRAESPWPSHPTLPSLDKASRGQP